MAVDELHDDEVGAGVLAPVEDRDDVRVAQLGRRLGLSAEALDEGRIDAQLGEEDLERHRPVEQLVVGPVDLGHAATGDQVRQLVATREDALFGDRLHGPLSLFRARRSSERRAAHLMPGTSSRSR